MTLKELSEKARHESESTVETCTASDGSPESLDSESSIEFSDHSLSDKIVRASKKDFCFKTLSENDAKFLKSTLSTLAEKYYPKMFPSNCTNAASALEGFYGYVKSCRFDSDCSYLNNNFYPVSLAGDYAISRAHDCSLVKPLLVANSFLAVSNQRDLIEKWEIAQEMCIEEPRYPHCSPVDFTR